MKIHDDVDKEHPIWKMWMEAGRKLSIEYGIVVLNFFDDENRRIYYIVNETEIDSVKDLRRILRMKAFL